MNRKWSVRLLAIGGITVALGCRSTPGTPVVTTPLFPEAVVAGPSVSGPLPTNLETLPPPIPGKPMSMPVGARLPNSLDIAPRILPESKPTVADIKPSNLQPKEGPSLPPIVPPADITNVASTPKGPAPIVTIPSGPIIKPRMIEAPRPSAGPDGFAPAPIIPPPTPPNELARPLLIETKPAPAPLPLPPSHKYGHGADYKWVAGVLDRHTKGGYWTLRYADIGADDEWGGKVRLLDDERLRELRDGDFVYLEGELLAPRRNGLAEGSYPPFRITDVRVIEKR
jgi:hypothetical protein